MNNSCLSRLIPLQADKYGDKIALKYRDYTQSLWVPVTWNQFAEKVNEVSNAMMALGVRVQENMGVFSQNKPECLYVDFGAFAVRGVTIPLYATSSEAQVHYILEDASIRYLFVGEQYQYDVAYRVQNLCRSLKQIIIFDPSVKRSPNDRHSIYFLNSWNWGKESRIRRKWTNALPNLRQTTWPISCILQELPANPKG